MSLQNNSPLFAEIITANDIASYRDKIEDVEKQLFKVKSEPAEAISEFFNERVYLAILDLLKKEDIDVKDPVAISNLLKEVEKRLSDLPVVDIALAFEPTRRQLKEIRLMIEKSFGGKAILNVEIDDSLIGGAVISYKGKMYDYSLRSRLRGYLK